jgi:hypothetical protein
MKINDCRRMKTRINRIRIEKQVNIKNECPERAKFE